MRYAKLLIIVSGRGHASYSKGVVCIATLRDHEYMQSLKLTSLNGLLTSQRSLGHDSICKTIHSLADAWTYFVQECAQVLTTLGSILTLCACSFCTTCGIEH